MLNFEAQMLHMYYQTTKKLMYLPVSDPLIVFVNF